MNTSSWLFSYANQFQMFLGAFCDGTSQKLLSDGNGVPLAGVGKIEAEISNKNIEGLTVAQEV